MSARPVIGIICCARRVGEETAQAVMERYLQAVAVHSDCAALLVPARSDLMDAREVAGRIDGLLLTGSPSNVEPNRYGDGVDRRGSVRSQARRDEPCDDRRNDWKGATRVRSLPWLSGAQRIVWRNPRRDLGEPARPLPHHAADVTALMRCSATSMKSLTPRNPGEQPRARRLRVNSVHYQGVDRLGHGLTIEASAPDGIVEAFSAAPDGAPVARGPMASRVARRARFGVDRILRVAGPGAARRN